MKSKIDNNKIRRIIKVVVEATVIGQVYIAIFSVIPRILAFSEVEGMFGASQYALLFSKYGADLLGAILGLLVAVAVFIDALRKKK